MLDVRHLGGDSSAPAASDSYTVGESHHVTLVVPPAGLPNGHGFALVRGRTLYFTNSMRGEVCDGGQARTLRELVHDGQATVRDSVYSYPLRAGARCRLEHGAVTFFVNVVPWQAPPRLAMQSSRRFWAFNARSLVLFASVLLPAYLATPTAGEPELSVDTRPAVRNVASFFSQPPPGGAQSVLAGSGLGDPRADGEDQPPGHGLGANRFGPPRSRGASARSSPQGSPLRPGTSPPLSGEGGGDGAGVGQGSGHGGGDPKVGSPSGHTEARVHAATTTSVHRSGNDRWNANSTRCQTLDLLAVKAKSYVPASRLTRIEPCDDPDPGGIPQMARNFDPDMMARNIGMLHALQGETDRPRSPDGQLFPVESGLEVRSGRGTVRVRQARAKVNGNLDHDIIRRIVRSHLGEIRHCYSDRLSRREDLRGRLWVQFTIGTNGKVSASHVPRSSLHDTRLENCIARAVRRWKFPKPKSGEVVVTTPFILSSH
ncbi:MAG: AgmX/PglI C-terminal domain-containing protein [Nannocystales bacterium]